MDNFRSNRALLNAKFEGYKLHAIPQDQAVRRYTLSRKPTQATASTKFPLSFQEMRSRITHNHLAVDNSSRHAVYVDQEYNVCLVGIPETVDDPPSFRVLYEMPTPMDRSSESDTPSIQKEYPSAVFLGSGAVAVTDGNGLLYVLPVKDDTATVEPVGIFVLKTGNTTGTPFKIHYVHRLSPVLAVLLLSSKYTPQDQKPREPGHSTSVEFDIWAAKISFLSLRPGPSVQEFSILWHRRGEDLPIYTTFIEEVRSFLIVGGSSYPEPHAAYSKHYEPSPDEIAPIPQANEDLDSATSELENLLISTSKPIKPPPYSWTQTSDSVTVAFPLPSSTPKTKMKVLFTMQTLTLHVGAFPLQTTETSPVRIPHYTTKALWDSINTSSCFWTWDREAEHTYGLLTLHMEKKNEGTRWMQVFAAAPEPTKEFHFGDDDQDVEVPESVDPSEMVKIREAMEKWTSSLATGEDSSGLGLGKGVPSLMEGEMDEETDAEVGRTAWVTWVGEDGATPGWVSSGTNDKDKRWEDVPITLLSTPLPGTTGGLAGLELVLKHDLDGVVFSPDFSDTSNVATKWVHTSTYCALAFVLASKQDTRFTFHLPGRGVLAFESGSFRDRGANVYIYLPSVFDKTGEGKGILKATWAKQSVLQISNGGGSLLGVGFVGDTTNGVLVCLIESEIVLVWGL